MESTLAIPSRQFSDTGDFSWGNGKIFKCWRTTRAPGASNFLDTFRSAATQTVSPIRRSCMLINQEFSIFAVLAGFLTVVGIARTQVSRPPADAANSANAPVIVELFT